MIYEKPTGLTSIQRFRLAVTKQRLPKPGAQGKLVVIVTRGNVFPLLSEFWTGSVFAQQKKVGQQLLTKACPYLLVKRCSLLGRQSVSAPGVAAATMTPG